MINKYLNDIRGIPPRKRETTEKTMYFRSDPDSREAYYDKEEPDVHVKVGASLGDLQFVWDRAKSNENIAHLGSHYMTRHLYDDKFRVLNGQKVGKDVVDIQTDAGNTGLLCSYDLENFTSAVDEDLPERIVVIVRQEILEDSRIRLISSYFTKKRNYIRWYWVNFNLRARYGSKRPDRLDKEASKPPEHVQEKLQQVMKVQKEVFDEVIEELVDRSIAAIDKLKKLLEAKTVPHWN
jgi:hypothetical protein